VEYLLRVITNIVSPRLAEESAPQGWSNRCQVDIDAGCANAEQSVSVLLGITVIAFIRCGTPTRVDPMIALPDE
jgi:hypothetical protein